MNQLVAFLRGLTARCVIVSAFSVVTVLGVGALSACAVLKITPDESVMTNLKELTILIAGALAGILSPRNETKPPITDQSQQPTQPVTSTP